MTYAAAYGATLAAFLVCDMVWLGSMVSRVYRPAIGDIMISGVNLAPAIVFYLLYPVGLVIFAVPVGIRSGSLLAGISYGALFGFFTYATYDLSNYATLRNWTLQLTVVDIAWGTVLGAIAAAAGCLAASKVNGIG